jgi:hypothetical protein
VQIEVMAKPLRLAIAALQALWNVASILPWESSASVMRSSHPALVSRPLRALHEGKDDSFRAVDSPRQDSWPLWDLK